MFPGRFGDLPQPESWRYRPEGIFEPEKSSAAKANTVQRPSISLKAKRASLISTPMAPREDRARLRAFIGKLSSGLAQRRQDHREEEADQRWIPIDAPVDLNYDNPVAELGPGDLFGEMTCMSLYPRYRRLYPPKPIALSSKCCATCSISCSANKNFRAALDKSYRSRALDSHLRAVPIFAELTDEFIGSLREKGGTGPLFPGPGDLTPGGDPADSFYLVRIGFGKSLCRRIPAETWCWPIFPAATISGETGLLLGDVRTATCAALRSRGTCPNGC